MLTYQDLLAVPETDEARMDFVRKAIKEHMLSDLYVTATTAEAYMARKNVTIVQYQKLLYTMSGESVPDNYSANFKMCSNFFGRFVTQESQYLLGNGVSWEKDDTADKVGDDFDDELQKIGRDALVSGVAFGFWNLDHIEGFTAREFKPLYDEENGSLSAGIRFWQVDPQKPLRATLYEIDGYTEFIWRKNEGAILNPKRPYKIMLRGTVVDGMQIYDGENYPAFPIVPLWGNPEHQSELVGIRESIDAYDLIKSGFANDLDDASQIYWIIQNAGGMDDIDLAKFLERIKTVKAAVVEDDGAKAESHTIDVPYAAREACLARIRDDLYEDFMALDTKNIAGGAATATEIKAAYEPINSKVDLFEYCVLRFLRSILLLAGIDDSPSFTRSVIVNAQENIQVIVQGAAYLSDEYVTRKILETLGDGDKADDVLKEMELTDMKRAGYGDEEDESEENEQAPRPGAQSGGQRADAN